MDHRPLHPSARRRHGDLRRRAGARDPADVPARTRLVTGRAPEQSGTRLQPRAGEDLGLRRSATLRRPGGHDDRTLPQQRLLPAVPAPARGRRPGRGDLDRHGQPVQSQQRVHADLAGGHPRIHHASIPVGACWLNLQEGWWRIFHKAALAGRSFANSDDIAYATAWQQTSSTPVPTPGSGADRSRQLAYYSADMCTPFEESSTRACPADHALDRTDQIRYRRISKTA